MGEVIFPGFVQLPRTENGLRLWVDGEPTDNKPRELATAKFQTLLGALRAWRADAGELEEERRAGLGSGPVRNEAGAQWVTVGTAVAYTSFGRTDVERFAEEARQALATSRNLENALWLYGRASRTAADFYMIHEYAGREYGGEKGVRDALGITVDAQRQLKVSANNLSPLDGGRHVNGRGSAPWNLEDQRRFISDLLKRWIRHAAAESTGAQSLD
jgi:hypothetical protein